MPFGKYNLRSPGVNKSLGRAQARYSRLCGPVEIIQKADPDKLKALRKKQKEANRIQKANKLR